VDALTVRNAVLYLRSSPKSTAACSLEQQLQHITAFMTRYDIREVARFVEVADDTFDELHAAARTARGAGAFVLLNHVDDLRETLDELVRDGVNFVSAQSATQAIMSFRSAR